MLAAESTPQNFIGDGLLADAENRRFYKSASLPLIQFLTNQLGDCGQAFLLIQPFLIVLVLVGFFLLAKEFTKSNWWALVAATVSIYPIEVNLGEYWGLLYEPLPRSIFAAFFPYLLLLGLKHADNPRRWPLVALSLGLLSYVHPPSGPVIAGAMFITLCTNIRGTFKQQLKPLALSVITFCLSISPLIASQLGHTRLTQTHGDLEFSAVLIELLDWDFFSVSTALIKFVSFSSVTYLIALFLLLLAVCLIFLGKAPDWAGASKLVITLMLGLLLSSTIIPLFEQAYWSLSGKIPSQIDFIRSLRYLIPLFELSCVISLCAISRRLGPKFSLLAGTALILWMPPPLSQNAQSNFKTVTSELVLAKQLNQGSRPIFTLDLQQGLLLRSVNRQPVVWTEKDGGFLSYTANQHFFAWYKIYMQIKARDWPNLLSELEERNTALILSKNAELSSNIRNSKHWNFVAIGADGSSIFQAKE